MRPTRQECPERKSAILGAKHTRSAPPCLPLLVVMAPLIGWGMASQLGPAEITGAEGVAGMVATVATAWLGRRHTERLSISIIVQGGCGDDDWSSTASHVEE